MQRTSIIYLFVVVIVVPAIFFLVEQMIVTDREAVNNVVHDVMQALVREDRETILDSVTEDVSLEGDLKKFNAVLMGRERTGRENLSALLEYGFQQAKFESYDIEEMKIKMEEEGRARVTISLDTTVSARSRSGRSRSIPANSKWRFQFRKSGERWKITHLRPLEWPRYYSGP